MSGIYMDVKGYGGRDVADCIREMVALSRRLQIDVWGEFNGIRTLARPDDQPEEVVRAWEQATVNKTPSRTAVAP